MATIADVRDLGSGLERSYEVLVRGRVKFRVGSLVYVAFFSDERVMGFAFPKEERDALVASDPRTFRLPSRVSDLRYHWVEAHLDRLGDDEMRELALDAWSMVVPKRVRRSVDEGGNPVLGEGAKPPTRSTGDATAERPGQAHRGA